MVREADLLAALTPQHSALRKIVTREEAVEQAERWRHRGWRVGFTNGYFDLLHQGHIQLLEQARAAVRPADRRAERRYQRSPAEGQPPSGAARSRSGGRAGQLRLRRSGLPVEEDTPEALIEALRPDVLIKGANHAAEDVVGADLVRGWGGRVRARSTY